MLFAPASPALVPHLAPQFPRPRGSTQTYRELILSRTPAAYWPLGETSGITAADATGHGYTLTLLNTPSLGEAGAISGDPSTSMFFGRAANEAAQRTASIPVSGSFPFTLETWLKTNTAGTARNIFNLTNSAGSVYVGLGINTANQPFIFSNGNGSTNDIAASDSAISTGIWYHLAGVFASATERRLYLNGVLVKTGTASRSGGTRDRMTLGRWVSNADGADSWLAHAAAHSSALSVDQILAHYRKGAGL